ncbi:response regulator [Chitinimonas sp. BJB300]|uniref:response regulator n=1 Tax=Chitinimonas sp. BJB300 TaxID=1559339 RepID=UPI000C0FEC1E|nr:two-component system response regulator [Chitinimonas sp. BJB300]PHV12420.1 two-component system response regulator [Chitinimonas sp. BJB300]TSJ89019.1 two-component system response regulator [Chitinimonas sp. BJB300]
MSNVLDPAEKRILLVVDDTPDNLALMSGMLRNEYKVKLAPNGERALQIAIGEGQPELILLDIMMPDMDGYEVLRQLKRDARTCDIPVIFLTAMSAAEDEKIGLDLGAVDYITKPVNPAIVQARVRTHLQLKSARDFLKDQNAFLESEVAKRTREVVAIQEVTIRTMASLAETRDNETGNHIRRTQHYVRVLAEALCKNPIYTQMLDARTIESLFKSAPLHDIGKVGIPDRILLKPGKLEADEFEIMKTHTTLGRDTILHSEQELGFEIDFLRYAKEIAHSHQEKWDGSGYPQGLVGEAIPLSARLMAVADVYDALISRRVYKPAFTHDEAVTYIRNGSGSHFDPAIVEAFLTVTEAFQEIAANYADPPPSE